MIVVVMGCMVFCHVVARNRRSWGREQIRHREAGWDERPKPYSLLPSFSVHSYPELWDTPRARVP